MCIILLQITKTMYTTCLFFVLTLNNTNIIIIYYGLFIFLVFDIIVSFYYRVVYRIVEMSTVVCAWDCDDADAFTFTFAFTVIA